MLVDKWPLPSKVPAQLVCHWLKGNAMLVLCNSIHEPPAVPFVAEIDSVVPLTLMPVICGDNNGRMICAGLKTAATKVLAGGVRLLRFHEYWMVSVPPLNPDK